MITKPMLAGKFESDDEIIAFFKKHSRVGVTLKIDGIRALMIGGNLLTRKFKLVPNVFIREALAALPDGADGELVIGNNFQASTSAIMSTGGEPENVKLMWFDYVKDSLTTPYEDRMRDLQRAFEERTFTNGVEVKILLPKVMTSADEFFEYVKQIRDSGGEGAMLRAMTGPYKCGRSSYREGYLLKYKFLEDSEAEVIGFVEKMHNANEADSDEFGNIKRSKCKEGMVPAGTLGALVVRDCYSGAEFEIGVFKGLKDDDKLQIWNNRKTVLGWVVKYTYQGVGVKDLPRIPVFHGWRDALDGD